MLPDLPPRSAFNRRSGSICFRVALIGIVLCGFAGRYLAQTAHLGSVPRTVVTGLASPIGVVVDPAGNLYVADTNNGRVLKETLFAGSYTPSIVASGLNLPYGIAVDSSGSVYVADTYNNRVVKEMLSGSSYTPTTIADVQTPVSGGATTGVSFPNGVTVDTSGNVYIADSGNNRVLKGTLSGGNYAYSVVDGGLNNPKGVAVDANGAVYIADTGNQRVVKEMPVTGAYVRSLVATSTAATSGSFPYDYPFGVAVDGRGNVSYSSYDAATSTSQILQAVPSFGGYASNVVWSGADQPFGLGADAVGNVYFTDAAAGSVVEVGVESTNFFYQPAASTSPSHTLSFVFDTGGTLGSYQVVTQGTAGLDFADAGGGTCAAGTTYSPGAACTVTVAFTPRFPGLRQGGVTLKNTSGIVIATAYLQGVGTGPQVGFTPGTISTVAGTGVQCSSSMAVCGDGGAATGANLWNPAGVVADAAENLYIADADDNRIRKVTPGGTISTVAGTGATGGNIGDGSAATSAQLYYPNCVAVDGAGNLYIADTNHHRIRRVDAATGTISTLAGDGTVGSSGDGGQATSAQLHNPFGLAVDGFGNVFIADTLNDEVRKVAASTGTITTVAGTHSQGYNGDGGLATGENLYLPHGITLDSSGNLFIADTSDQRIRRVDAATGIISTVAGNGGNGVSGDGGSATSATLTNPASVLVDAAGNFYVADQGNERIRKVSISTGVISTVVGTGADTSTGDGGAASNGTVAAPFGLALDGAGNLYSSDYDTHRVRRISAAANPLTFASTALGNTSSDSPQTVTLHNIGNAGLTLALPSNPGTRNPSVSTGFLFAGSSTCPQLSSTSSPFVLTAGTSCTEVLSFAPQTAGAFNGSSVSIDDALNAAGAMQAIPLAGVATQATPTVTVNSAATIYGTANTTLTAIITFGGVADTGSVTFAIDNGAAVGSCNAMGTYTESCTVGYNTASLAGGVHTISVIVAGDANYHSAFGTGTLTIGKASPTVNASSASAVYGSASTTLKASVAYTGAASPMGGLNFTVDNGAAVAATCTGTSSPLSCTAGYPTVSFGAGSHVVTAAVAADTNYNQAGGMAALTVTPVTPSLSVVPLSITYGTTSAGLTATLTYGGAAAPTGVLTFAVDGGTALTGTCAGSVSPLLCSVSYPSSSLVAGPHTVTVTFAGDANYTALSRSVSVLTVTQATPIVTWSTPAPISYGTALTSAQLDATATVPGSFAYSPGAGTVLPVGMRTLSVTFTPADTTDYTTTTRTVALTVNPSAPVCSLSVQGTSTVLTVVAVASCTDPQGQPLTTVLDWGDKTTTAVSVPRNIHTYTAAGTYTVVLTATDTSSLTGKAQQQITPSQTPVCTLGSIQASSAMSNAGMVSYVFSVTASCTDPQGQQLRATIDWGDGTTQAALANGVNSHPYANPATTRTYSVVLTATDGVGLAGTATQSVMVVPAPTSAAGAPATVSTTIAPQPASVPDAQLTVTFLCSSVLAAGSTTPALPAQYGISCSSDPQTVLTGAPVQVNITIRSTAAGGTAVASHSVRNEALAWCALLFPVPGLGLFALGALSRVRRRQFHAMGLVLLLCLTLTSCGGSFTPPLQVATPSGTYFLTVTEGAACSSSTGAACPALPTGFVQTSLIVPLTIHP